MSCQSSPALVMMVCIIVSYDDNNCDDRNNNNENDSHHNDFIHGVHYCFVGHGAAEVHRYSAGRCA